MRTSTLLVLMTCLAPALIGQESPSDPYSALRVRQILERRSVGAILGLDQKFLFGLGDACAIAILKTSDQRDLENPKTAGAISDLLHDAFSHLEAVRVPSDRQPKVSLFLLKYLLENVSDEGVKKKIQRTIEFVSAKAITEPSPTVHPN